jgi:hypothetical protein
MHDMPRCGGWTGTEFSFVDYRQGWGMVVYMVLETGFGKARW